MNWRQNVNGKRVHKIKQMGKGRIGTVEIARIDTHVKNEYDLFFFLCEKKGEPIKSMTI